MKATAFLKLFRRYGSDDKALWHSPWEVISKGKGSPTSAAYLESWTSLEKAWRTGQNHKIAGNRVYKKAVEISGKFASPLLLFLEKIFNDIQFFKKKSCILYIGVSSVSALFCFFFSTNL